MVKNIIRKRLVELFRTFRSIRPVNRSTLFYGLGPAHFLAAAHSYSGPSCVFVVDASMPNRLVDPRVRTLLRFIRDGPRLLRASVPEPTGPKAVFALIWSTVPV